MILGHPLFPGPARPEVLWAPRTNGARETACFLPFEDLRPGVHLPPSGGNRGPARVAGNALGESLVCCRGNSLGGAPGRFPALGTEDNLERIPLFWTTTLLAGRRRAGAEGADIHPGNGIKLKGGKRSGKELVTGSGFYREKSLKERSARS